MTAIDPLPEDADIARQIFLHTCFHFLAIAFLYYDHMITLDQEIMFIWNRRKTSSAYWFLANRYLAFASNIAVTILSFTPLTPKVHAVQPLPAATAGSHPSPDLHPTRPQDIRYIQLRSTRADLHGLLWSGLTHRILRSDSDFVNQWALLDQHVAPAQPSTGCHIGLASVTGIHLAVAWEALFIYDSLIVLMTLLKTYQTRRNRDHIPLLWLVFRDGVIFFVVMALANLSNILTFYLAGPFLRGGLSTFASSISVTMMSRLMLNLHKTAESGITTSGYAMTGTMTGTSSEITSIFAAATMNSNYVLHRDDSEERTSLEDRQNDTGRTRDGDVEMDDLNLPELPCS